MKRLQQVCVRVVGMRTFDNVVIVMILATAVGLGVDTSETLGVRLGALVEWVYLAALAVFILEAAAFMSMVQPCGWFGEHP